MRLRRATSRIVLAVALAAAAASSGCGEGAGPARRSGPAGKIEGLREQQERAQEKIEAEGQKSAQQVKREQEARLAEAQREGEDRPTRPR